jgi:glycosyltransferase involved in cell wall biosynthesis
MMIDKTPHKPTSAPVKISVVIVTLNEEKNIARCLLSVQKIADEILVVDSFSTDRTEEICKAHNVRFIQHGFIGFVEHKSWAASQATYDHLLCLDGDEALSEELQESILMVKSNWRHAGYRFNRLANYCGKWIRHGGWYPDIKLRLWDRRQGYIGGTNPHERIILNPGAECRHLRGDLLHYAFDTISEHLLLADKYSDVKAKGMFNRQKKAGWLNLFLNPLFKFLRDYLLKLGFLDGFYGFVICIIGAQSNFFKYAKLKQMYLEKSIHLNKKQNGS